MLAALYWEGDVDRNWSTPGNWSGNQAPVNGDDLFFDTNISGFANSSFIDKFSPVNDLANLQLGSITIQDDFDALSGPDNFALSGDAISLQFGMTINGDLQGSIGFDSITLLADQTLDINGNYYNWTSPIDIQSHTLNFQGANTFVSGLIEGAGDVIFQGGTTYLNSPNSYTGLTTIQQATVILQSQGQLGSLDNPTNANAGRLIVSTNVTNSELINIEASNFTVELRNGSNQAGGLNVITDNLLQINYVNAAGSATISGSITGVAAGSGLRYSIPADSSIEVANVSSLSGATEVVGAGTLLVNGLHLQSPLTMSGTTTLAGNGTIFAPVTVNAGATLAPGTSVGVLTSLDLTLLAGSNLEIEIAPGGVGSENDQLQVSGALNLDGNLDLILLDEHVPQPGETLTIIENTSQSSTSGTFVGLGEGTTFEQDGVTYQITYAGGLDSNDVVLTVVNNSLVVENTADAGPGSLRQAILDANAIPGPDRIEFSISGPGPHTIQLSTNLPNLSEQVTIDGYTQAGSITNTNPNAINAVLMVEVNGTNIGSGGVGFRIVDDNSAIQGLAINGFASRGIVVDGGIGNRVEGNFIGTNVTGDAGLGNAVGVEILGGATDNFVGTDGDGVDDLAERNLISGNTQYGVFVSGVGSNGNVIAGNLIGTGADGNSDLGNGIHGLVVRGGALNTRIGTNGSHDTGDQHERNVISANDGWTAVLIADQGTDGTIIAGNYIGLDAHGTSPWGNNGHPIAVLNGPDNTRIGTDGNGLGDTDERNVVGGNVWDIVVEGETTDGTVIAGNYLGTNADGDQAIPNGSGVTVRYGPTNTRIGTDGSNDAFNENERNVISGNSWVGIQIATVQWNGQVPANGATTDSTVIAGNYIGLNAAGTAPLGNGSAGIYAANRPTNLRIGTNDDGIADDLERNVISGNSGSGVQVEGWNYFNLQTVDHFIAGDIPATTVSESISQADLYDPTAGSDGNWTFNNPVPGGGSNRYVFEATGTLQVNTAGTYTFALGGDDGGRLRIGEADVVVDDSFHGFTDFFGSIYLNQGTHEFQWVGFQGGGDAAFELAVAVGGNQSSPVTEGNGWRVLGAANPHSEISLQNSIAATVFYPDPGQLNISIAGNYIGTNRNGLVDTVSFGNAGDGVLLLNRAQGISIGGNSTALRNVISGNGSDGIDINGGNSLGSPTSLNQIIGNYIGTDRNGQARLGNSGRGILVRNQADETDISKNLVSGNYWDGIGFLNTGPIGSVVTGNLVGLNVNDDVLSNIGSGISISNSPNITVGDATEAGRNVISGNNVRGINITGSASTGNLIQGNFIGTNADGSADRGNLKDGISIGDRFMFADSGGAPANSNIIGGLAVGAGNLISGNGGSGVYIAGSGADSNQILGNLIGTNAQGMGALANAEDGIRISGGDLNQIGGPLSGARNIISGNSGYGVLIEGTLPDVTTLTIAEEIIDGTRPLRNSISTTIDQLDLADPLGQSGGNWGYNHQIPGRGGGQFAYVATGKLWVNSPGDFTFALTVDAGGGFRIDGNDVVLDPVSNGYNTVFANTYLSAGEHTFEAIGFERIPTVAFEVSVAAGANRAGPISSNNGWRIIGDTSPLPEIELFDGPIDLTVYYPAGVGPASNNVIAGNWIGADISGDVPLGNLSGGVFIDRVASNTIGGTGTARNVISGNTGHGVVISGSDANSNVVRGNFIGTTQAGVAAQGLIEIGNAGSGVVLKDSAQANSVDGNTISGNLANGLWITGTATAANLITGNLIGTESNGNVALGNVHGVRIDQGASNNTIGGIVLSARNIISGNHADGVLIADPGTTGNLVQGNLIGTKPDGNAQLANQGAGVLIQDAAMNQIGGASTVVASMLTGAGNLISGNLDAGVKIRSFTSAADSNSIRGNFIGTNISGGLAISNMGLAGIVVIDSDGTRIGGTSDSMRNVISGNAASGVFLAGSNQTLLEGNYIGTKATGASALGNTAHGIEILAGSAGTLVGGPLIGQRNVISGNIGSGVYVVQPGSGTKIQGNFIGTDKTGSLPVGNASTTSSSAAGVLISSTGGNRVIIGVDDDDPGTEHAKHGNVISGNFRNGVRIQGGNSDAGSHVVAGNKIGVSFGVEALPNQGDGIVVLSSSNNWIGTDSDGKFDALEGNVIAANRNLGQNPAGTSLQARGIWIYDADPQDSLLTEFNTVAGNFIGTNSAGIKTLGNQAAGISIERATNTIIGSSDAVGQNLVFFGGDDGIEISGFGENGLTAELSTDVRRNRFKSNTQLAIDVGSSSVSLNDASDLDGTLNFPIITSTAVADGNLTIAGFVPAGRTFELYSASAEAGAQFGEGLNLLATFVEGTNDTDGSVGTYGPDVNGVTVATGPITESAFEFTIPLPTGVANGTLLTARTVGSTSEFSPLVVAGQQTSALPPTITLTSPPASVEAGSQLFVNGSFVDSDSTEWTATVDYGDGSGSQQLALNTNRTFQLNHTYAAAGNFTVTVQITDNSLATGNASFAIEVTNPAPSANVSEFTRTATVDEGQLASISGPLNAAIVDTVTIDWGDGAPETVLQKGVDFSPTATSFSANHTYRDDSNRDPADPASVDTPSAEDVYQIRVTIDGPGGSITTQSGLLPVQVRNVRPNNLVVTPSSTLLVEGDTLSLTGSFADPGILDTHKVKIDWGDGTIVSHTLPAGITDLSQLPLDKRTHTYVDDPAAGADQYTVRVEVTDDDEPDSLSSVKFVQIISLANALPSAVNLNLSQTTITEGGLVTLTGSFADAGINDTHRVLIDWGDGSTQFVDLAKGVTQFPNPNLPIPQPITHVYPNDPAGTTPSYTISVRVTDNDAPASLDPISTASATVSVNNSNPVLSSLTLKKNGVILGPGETINEGDTVTLTGTYSDAGTLDRHQVEVNWGDNKPATLATVNAAIKTFSATYTYLDNFNYQDNISVTLRDGRFLVPSVFEADGPGVSDSLTLQVENIAPRVIIAPSLASTPTDTTLIAQVTDPGKDDTQTFVWTIDGVIVDSDLDPAPERLRFDATAFTTPPIIEVSVTDDDGAVGGFDVLAIFGTDADEILTVGSGGGTIDYTIDDETTTVESVSLITPSPSNNVLVMGFGGADTLDASGLEAAYQAILDGGAQTDYLIGGAGQDTFYSHNGNDTVDGGAGDDTFLVVPNSTLTVIDTSGDNVLDFSLADFGDFSGISFDLDLIPTNAATPGEQIVSTAGSVHIVDARGRFTRLIGSSFDDTLTAATNSSIDGGKGNDTFNLKDGTSGVTLNGGADDDIFNVEAGVVLSNISFGGDDGLDIFTNLGTVDDLTFTGGADDDVFTNSGTLTGTLVFDGGADDDIFTNEATAIIEGLSFGGDDGVDIFENLGQVTVSLTFNGGADDDVFSNHGTIANLTFVGGADDDVFTNEVAGVINGLSFGGDDGVDDFTNLGTIANLTFDGGADDDVFTNLGTLQGTLVFAGGADDDVFTNEAVGVIEGLSFAGDEGADVFTNLGTISVSLTFNGGADDDLFSNAGTIFGLSFGGDEGADVFINTGTVTDLNFGGDDGADIFTNFGSLEGTLVFSGGADDDIFFNELGGTIAELSFGGDEGADLFQNLGTVTELTFSGGADDDIFTNAGTVGEMVFGGDEGADVLQNLGTITVSLTFHGDEGADILTNLADVPTLTFNGGADDDVFTNSGDISSGLVFTGDEGADLLVNSGTVVDLIFNGGADDDVFTNFGDVLTNTQGLVFNGDEGADLFENAGTVGDLTFTGGADDDVFNNVGPVTNLSFEGDEGADFLQNTGTVENLSFGGDEGADILNNLGDVTTTLTFHGGADDDIFVNAGTIGDLTFTGGADADVLQNNGFVNQLRFGGDEGADILLNYGDFEDLVFVGGADDDVFTSYGEMVGSISFEGDLAPTSPNYDPNIGGNDTLILHGSGDDQPTSTVYFSGGPGSDAFQNNAIGFQSIQYLGGADDDVFQNNAHHISELSFAGDEGADIFENNGNEVTSLSFSGDEGADTFYNDGSQVANLSFNGGADDDVFINSGDGLMGLVFNGDMDPDGTNANAADDGIDTLINSGDDVVNLTFQGGADDDVFLNVGVNLDNLVFNGDDGNDRFWNQSAGVQASNITFNGDDGADIFINDAASATGLIFNGGADNDGFQNNGSGVSTVMILGGSGDEVIINTGASLDGLQFRGNLGDDAFSNRGNDVGLIEMWGDEGADLFVNDGLTALELVFSGGADDDVFTNNGEAQSLTFTGGADDDILQNNGTLGDVVFTGGADDDLFQNNGPAETLVFWGGADDDVFINNGDNVASLSFGGDEGVDTLISNGDGLGELIFSGGADGDYLRLSGSGHGNVDFQGAQGGDTFEYNATAAAGSQIEFFGGGGNDLLAWLGTAEAATFYAGDGDDLSFVVGSGSLTLNGDLGDDSYTFVGNPQANVRVGESYSGTDDVSVDTLNFSTFTGGPLDIDLRSLVPQTQSAKFTLTLTDELGVEAMIGTQFGDTIGGNARDNLIYGAEYSEGFSGQVAGSRGETQWVLLDFDSRTETGEHVYTPEERDTIEARLESVYRGPNVGSPWFDVEFTQNSNEIPAEIDRNFVTIFFNDTPDFGRPGGLASEVDLGNVNLDGSAQVQVNGLLGGTVTADEANSDNHENPLPGGLPSHATMFGDAQVGSLKPEASSENFVLLSAKIAAHELGHLMGLRHQDSFGPIGFGIHDPPGSGAYNPTYTGPVGGFESFDHLLGSPASIGSSRFTDLNDLFFGEREAVKLAFAGSDPNDTRVDEQLSPHATWDTAQSLTLVNLAVPNTLSHGINLVKDQFVQIQSVLGQIQIDLSTLVSENDWYSFTGTAGDLINIDVLSNSLVGRFGTGPNDFVDTILRVYSVDADGNLALVPYHGGVAENDDQFEPTDSSIIDLKLPADGTYYIEVDTFYRDNNDPNRAAAEAARAKLEARRDDGDPSNDLSRAEVDALQRLVDTLEDSDIGQYQLIIYRTAQANQVDGADVIKGNGGNDFIEAGADDISYVLTFDIGDDVQQKVDTEFELNSFVWDPGANNWDGSTVNFGDGTGSQNLQVAADGSFTLNHVYTEGGVFTVTVTIVDDIGQQLTDSLAATVIVNTDPEIDVESTFITVDEGSPAINFGTFSDIDLDNNVTVTASVGNIVEQSSGNTGNWRWEYPTNDELDATVVIITADDGQGGIATVSFHYRVDNVAPQNLSIDSAVSDLVFAVGESQVFQGTFFDPGTTDVHTAHWTFSHAVDQTIVSDQRIASVSGHAVSDNLTFDEPGVYRVSLTVVDNDGGQATSSERTFVVYDPAGGFVTGGGWFHSPEGAYVVDPTLTGKAKFNFNPKYKKGKNTIQGKFSFDFKEGDFKFQSTDFNWLVVAGARAQFNGEGTINGSGSFKFSLTVLDGQLSGGGGIDKLHLKIWDGELGASIYDNAFGAADDTIPAAALGGGQIVIHTNGNALLAQHAENRPPAGIESLSEETLQEYFLQAKDYWNDYLGSSRELSRVEIVLSNLPDSMLGLSSNSNNKIWIDRDAAGFGWATDTNLGYDLLSVVVHELGHQLGYEHDTLGETLALGVRSLPFAHQGNDDPTKPVLHPHAFLGPQIVPIVLKEIENPSNAAAMRPGQSAATLPGQTAYSAIRLPPGALRGFDQTIQATAWENMLHDRSRTDRNGSRGANPSMKNTDAVYNLLGQSNTAIFDLAFADDCPDDREEEAGTDLYFADLEDEIRSPAEEIHIAKHIGIEDRQ